MKALIVAAITSPIILLTQGCTNYLKSSTDYDNQIPWALGETPDGEPVIEFEKTRVRLYLNPELSAEEITTAWDLNYTKTEDGFSAQSSDGQRKGGMFLTAKSLNTKHNVEAIAEVTERDAEVTQTVVDSAGNVIGTVIQTLVTP